MIIGARLNNTYAVRVATVRIAPCPISSRRLICVARASPSLRVSIMTFNSKKSKDL